MPDRVFAFVFARGGSKGLPRKNVLPLAGLPLIAHSIRCAQHVAEVDRVFVSTDDAEIADVAREWKAEVIERPAELATDQASEWLAWRHAIVEAQDRAGTFDTFVSLPPTSPLRAKVDVERCLQALRSDVDMVITVTPSARNPYFNMVTRTPDGNSRLCIEGQSHARRQDAPTVYDITTVAYATRPSFVLTHERLFDGRVHSVVVPRERAADIDDALDFQWCDFLLAQSNGRKYAE